MRLVSWSMVLMANLALPATRMDAQQSRPNVVVILCDDMGWGDAAYHGTNKIVKTPHLDTMAKSGVRFNRFYAASPLCSPTRAALLSGRFPTRYNCYLPRDVLPGSERTIAELLRAVGYVCGHFGKWHIGDLAADAPTSPGAQGFHQWFSIYNDYMVPRTDTRGFNRNGQGGIQTKGYVEDVIFDEALGFIRASAKKREPFFAFICTLAPHAPYEAPKRLQALYPGLPENEQSYWGMISSIDENTGRLRDELRKLGIADDTIVIFTSDNGSTRISNRHTPFSGFKGTLWEGGLRVPGLLTWPGRYRTPFETDMPTYSCDLLPTLLAAAGTSLPKDARPLDGIDLLPLLDKKANERPSPIVFHFDDRKKAKEGAKKSALGERGFVVLDNNHRLITSLDGKSVKLFDITKDPAERTDLSATEKNTVARLQGIRESWWASVQNEPGFTGTRTSTKAKQ